MASTNLRKTPLIISRKIVLDCSCVLIHFFTTEMLYFNKKTIKRIALLTYLSLLFLLYLSPTVSTYNPTQSLIKHIPHNDKLSHFFLFLLLSHLCFIQQYPAHFRHAITLIGVLLFFAIGLELAHLLIPARRFEWLDMSANIAGIVTYAVFFSLRLRHRRKQ